MWFPIIGAVFLLASTSLADNSTVAENPTVSSCHSEWELVNECFNNSPYELRCGYAMYKGWTSVDEDALTAIEAGRVSDKVKAMKKELEKVSGKTLQEIWAEQLRHYGDLHADAITSIDSDEIKREPWTELIVPPGQVYRKMKLRMVCGDLQYLSDISVLQSLW